MSDPGPNQSGALLRQVELFRNLDTETLDELLRHCRRRTYKARTILFEEGDPGHTLFVVVNGTAVVQKISPDSGAPVFVAERVSGECFGEMALFDDAPRSATVVAQPGSEMLLLGREDFLRCVRKHPEVALAVIRTLSARLRDAAEQSLRHSGLDVMGRLAAYLLEHATERPPNDGSRKVYRRLDPRPSDRIIGERITATRETVSRKLSQLVAMKIIERTNEVLILRDEARLSALCAGAAPARPGGGKDNK